MQEVLAKVLVMRPEVRIWPYVHDNVALDSR